MNSNLILTIALRLLYSRMKQSVVAAVGVTFGVAMFVTLLSFMNGLNQMLDGLMLNRTPHVLLYNEVKPSENQPLKMVDSLKNNVVIIGSLKPKDRGKEIYNALAVVRSLKQDARVFDVAPKINAQVFFNSGSIEIAGVVNGIDVLPEEKLYKISDYIIEGEVKDLLQQNTIIIGKGLSEKMMLTKGDAVKVTTAKGDLALLKIVGISQIGISEIDNTFSYTSLETAQKLLGKPKSYITDIQIKLFDITTSPSVAKEFQEKFELDAIDYQTANSIFRNLIESGLPLPDEMPYYFSETLFALGQYDNSSNFLNKYLELKARQAI